jgi:hypothetical protein
MGEESLLLAREHAVVSESEVAIDLDPSALDRLRSLPISRVSAFPLHPGIRVDLILERFSPLARDARVRIGYGQPQTLTLVDDVQHFAGYVVGATNSVVYLIAYTDRLQGVLTHGPRTYVIGSSGLRGTGRHWVRDLAFEVTWAMSPRWRPTTGEIPSGAVGAPAPPPPNDLPFTARPANFLHELASAVYRVYRGALGWGPALAQADPDDEVPCGGAILAAGSGQGGTAGNRPGLLKARLAIDVPAVWRPYFADDHGRLIAYVYNLFAAVSAIYRREVGLDFEIGLIQIWDTDPIEYGVNIFDGKLMLDTFRDFWNRHFPPCNGTSTPGCVDRDLAHMLHFDGAPGNGYFAENYSVLCGPGAYARSKVKPADFGSLTGDALRYVVRVAHELGHNFGSNHTHCYVPPIDLCGSENQGIPRGHVNRCVNEIRRPASC